MTKKTKIVQKLNLASLLARRKITFSKFASDYNITSSDELRIVCDKLSIEMPSQEFLNENFFKGEKTKPEEGIIVIEPSIEENHVKEALDSSGEQEVTTEFLNDKDFVEEKKKKRKRKDIE